MSSNLPDFEKAEYLGQPEAPVYPNQIVSGDVRSYEHRADHDRFVHAVAYGIAAAIVGSILYAAFNIVTHITIGYAAVGVGFLIGKAMLHATKGLGGRKFQVVAAALTYLSVSMAEIPEFLWEMHESHRAFVHYSAKLISLLVGFALASPFILVQHNFGSGLIGLFILFIGIRFAWRMTADRRLPQ
ncbi:hypothetical protein [Granulicella aggregans]|jgi:hypothetical protein|uniref:hypothetical protein n=1 Tax=Granulicella aggregans TaxID=474949 RepID=UPI0021E09EAE|nr:hypothetical protein [Granulicella aggregans]